jgi:hypothetical protein
MSPHRYQRVSPIIPSSRQQVVGLVVVNSQCWIQNLIDLQVDTHTEEDDRSVVEQNTPVAIPSSPPPSFRSRASSPTSRLLAQDPLHSEADRTLADTFGDDDSDSEADEEIDDRQRLMRGSPSTPTGDTRSETNVQQQRPDPQRTYTTLPAFTPSTSTTTAPRIIHDSHDGVFANMAAKPERGEKLEDLPPVSTHPSSLGYHSH